MTNLRFPSRPRAGVLVAVLCVAGLSACGGGNGGGRSWNPVKWITSPLQERAPETLEPRGGYQTALPGDPISQVLSVKWEPLNEGRLLVVTGIAPTQGWHDAALVNQSSAPDGRVVPDADGVLRLRMTVRAPDPASPDARRAARPGADTITAAIPISTAELRGIGAVSVSGATNEITVRR